MAETSDEIKALIRSGYARTSRKYGLVSRLDREDWRAHMAERHSPSNVARGREWVSNMGSRAADFYRRVYSKDTLELGQSRGLKFPSSDEGPCEYRPLSSL